MKKISFILIAIATLSMLVGCFEDNSTNDKSGEENKNITNNNNVNTEVAEFSMGAWNGNVYKNEFLKINYEMPTTWNHSSNAEIASIMNISSDIPFGGEEFNNKVKSSSSAYYVVANDPDTGNNLSIVSEKSLVDITTEDYLNKLKTQLEAIEGITYETSEMSKASIGNVEYNTLDVKISEYNLTQRYYVRKQNDNFIGIIITATEGSSIEEIIKSFK